MNSSRKLSLAVVVVGLTVVLTSGLQFSPVPQPLRSARIALDQFESRSETRQSIVQLDTLLKFDSWSTQYRAQRARAYLQLSNSQLAMADLTALFDQPDISGEEVLLLAALHLQSGEVSNAKQTLRDALQRGILDEGDTKKSLETAPIQQDWWTASAALLAQDMIRPNDAATLERLAVVQALDQPQLAVETVVQASALDAGVQTQLGDLGAHLQSLPSPDPIARYAELGTIYAAMGQFRIAETALTRAVNSSPAYGEALGYLAYVRARLGKPSLGIMNQSIELAPSSPTTHFLAGLTWKALGRTVEARAAFERAHDLDPSNPSTAVEIASTHRAETASAYAEAWMLEAVRLSGGDQRFRILLAQFYVDDNYRVSDSGFPLAQQLVIDAPDSAEAHDALGWAYFLLGGMDRAAEQLNRALVLNPSLPRVHTHLGALFEAQGNPAAAIEFYNRASELDPNGSFGALARRALARLNP